MHNFAISELFITLSFHILYVDQSDALQYVMMMWQCDTFKQTVCFQAVKYNAISVRSSLSHLNLLAFAFS